MDQADAFLRAIAADPADDAPRLIFADWLDDRGDEADRAQAEFIRVQYALGETPLDDPRRAQLEERETALLLAHEAQWTGVLRGLNVSGCQFRRGFVEKISIAPWALAAHGAEIFRHAPVREVQLRPIGWGVAYGTVRATTLRLADAPWLEHVHSLDLSRMRVSDWVQGNLLHSPRLGRLRGLALDCDGLTPDVLGQAPFVSGLTRLTLTGYLNPYTADAWLGSGKFTGLTHLELNGERWLQREMAALAEAPPPRLQSLALLRGRPTEQLLEPLLRTRIPTLRRLTLNNSPLGVGVVRALAGAALLEGVEELDLGTSGIGDEGAGLLARSAALGRVQRLNLSSNGLGPAACAALGAGELAALRSLHVRANHIGDEGLRALARGGALAKLRALSASHNRITSLGALELADAFPAEMEVLSLSWNRIGDAGVMALAGTAGAARLAALDLGYCELGDAAAAALAAARGLARLSTLNLGVNRIGDAGLAALAASPHLGRLEALNLGHNPVGDAGVLALFASPLLAGLTALHLHGTHVSDAQRRRLRQAFRGILG